MTKKRAFVAKALWLLVAAGLIFIGNFGITPAITAQAGSEVVTFHVSPNPGLAEQSYILEFSLYQGTPALDYTDVPIDMDQNDSSAKTESYDRITPLSTIVTIIYRGNGHTGGYSTRKPISHYAWFYTSQATGQLGKDRVYVRWLARWGW